MNSDWPIRTVQQLIDAGVIDRPMDGNHGAIHPKTIDYVSNGVPFIMASDLKNGHVNFDSCAFITPQHARTLRKGFSRTGDVLLSHKATLGRTAIVQDSQYEFLVLTPQVTYYRILDSNVLNHNFLKYYFDSRDFQNTLMSWAGAGSTRAYIGITDQKRLPICVPPISVQRRVVEVVEPLDRKIELNHRMKETLEATAQAIFRDWFVDFGPVRRKLAGETDPVAVMGGLTLDPIRAGDLAELFPREMLNDLPIGWGMSTLGETTNAILGGTPSRKVPTYWGGRVPWINSGEVNEFRITRPTEFITNEGLAKSATKLLPRRTTVLAITGATLGQVSLTEIATCANQSVVGLVPDGRLPAEFVYLAVKSCIDDIVARQTGGAQQHINKGNVEEQPVMVPSSKILEAWSGISVPIFDRIAACCFENQTLAETRDYLLPRLMSGKVRVAPFNTESAAA